VSMPPPPPDEPSPASPPPPPPVRTRAIPPVTAPPEGDRDGKLITAGVLSVISATVVGAFGVLFAIVGVAVTDDGGGESWLFDNAEWGWLFIVIGIVLLAVAAAYLVAGIGCLRGRPWARILNVVVHGAAVLLTVLAIVDGDAGSFAVPLVWSGTALGLSAAGRPWA
jgi:hypothetical protein